MIKYYIIFKGERNKWHVSSVPDINAIGFNTMNELFEFIHSPDFHFNKSWQYGIRKNEETKMEVI